MKTGIRHLSRQRGVAVVTALLLTTLSITIVASLFWQQQVQVRSIENQRLQLQKQWILRGALDWAALILRADAVTSNADHLGEPWAVPLAETRLDQYVENGKADGDASDATLSGSIIDAQSRYNLNNLAVGGKIVPTEVEVLRNLLTGLRLNASLAPAVAEAVAAGQVKQPVAGARPVPAVSSTGPRPMKIDYVDDLLLVPGFTPQIFNKLKDYVTVLPGTTKINANTAPLEVLAAKMATVATLTQADAATLVASRESAYLRDPAEIGTRLNKNGVNYNFLEGKTDYFFVNGKVSMNRAGLEIQALLKREGRTMPKVIWIREN
jgi:general secretion pathway protein K